MASNTLKICLCCGRTFIARDSKHPFCSMTCKRRYSYRRQFRCAECRNASCTVRNEYSCTVPAGCPNFGWEPPRSETILYGHYIGSNTNASSPIVRMNKNNY